MDNAYEFRGALKSNIGHLEGGSGIAGVIKAVLVLEKGIIPPNANFQEINPNIDAEFLNIKVSESSLLQSKFLLTDNKFPTESVPWPCKGLRRASVNSFGFGGSNSHCILDDAYHFLESHSLHGKHNTAVNSHDQPEAIVCHADDGPIHANGLRTITEEVKVTSLPSKEPAYIPMAKDIQTMYRRPQLLLWSSADKDGLLRLAEAYSLHSENVLSKKDTNYLEDLAYTLAFRRSSLPWRSFLVADDISDLRKLQKLISLPTRITTNRGIAFVFTGQGAQYSQMGLSLLSFPKFNATLREIEGILKRLGCSWSLLGQSESINIFEVICINLYQMSFVWIQNLPI